MDERKDSHGSGGNSEQARRNSKRSLPRKVYSFDPNDKPQDKKHFFTPRRDVGVPGTGRRPHGTHTSPGGEVSRTPEGGASRSRTGVSTHGTHGGGARNERNPRGGAGDKRTSFGRGRGSRGAEGHKKDGGRGVSSSVRKSGGRMPRGRETARKTNFAPNRVLKGPPIPPLEEGRIRIIPLGGVEAIGRNMTVFETKDDIMIIDMGFQFSGEETPGIDYIIPNVQYLEERKEKIRAVFVTHGHLDHIGAIPYVMGKIGNPPIYTRNLTALLIKKRQTEFPDLPPLDIEVVEKNSRVKVGNMHVRLFAVSHAIPDSMGIIIETPYGDIVHTGDLRVDNHNGVPTEVEAEEFSQFKDKKVLLLLADSTNVENPGFSLAEKVVLKNIEEVIVKVRGRLIIGTFASQLERIIKIIDVCEQHGKKVVIEGRSMKTNVEVAKEVGLLKTKKDTLITADEMADYPANKLVVIATGSQGEEFAALMRMGNKTHKQVKINKTDTVLLSSSIIPGNEIGVQKIKDNISRQGAKIVHYRMSDIHASGHANRDELAWIHRQINPKFFIPIHGHHYMLRVHADVAMAGGIPEKNIVIPDNGMIIEIAENGEKILSLKETAPSNIVLVDGFSVGDIQEVVIRDRQILAEDGMFIIVAVVDLSTRKLRKSPDIISRGFVYLRESQDLLRQARFIIKKTIEDGAEGMNPINFEYIKGLVSDNIGRYLLQETAKRPIVLPVILGV